jgi:hypothetical protein
MRSSEISRRNIRINTFQLIKHYEKMYLSVNKIRHRVADKILVSIDGMIGVGGRYVANVVTGTLLTAQRIYTC